MLLKKSLTSTSKTAAILTRCSILKCLSLIPNSATEIVPTDLCPIAKERFN